MNLNTTLKVICEALFSNPATASQFATADANVNRSQFATLTSGVGLNQVDKAFSETRTIAAAGDHTYDLTALTDIFAGALAFVRVKAILIFAAAANTNNVVMGNAAGDQFLGPLGAANDTISVAPGGCLVCLAPTAAGWALGITTDLMIANSAGGTGVTYDLLILGGAS